MKIKRKFNETSIKVLNIDSHSKNVIYGFSGFGYTIECPLLYYIGNIAAQHKFDFIGFDCDYSNNDNFQKLSDEERTTYFELDIDLIRNYILEGKYQKRIFAGKSLGATIMNRLMEKGEIIKNDDLIYITPGIEWNKIILNIENCQNKTLIIGSRGDSLFTLYDYSRLKTNKNINIIEFEKENHVLEIGEIQNDLDVLANVITGIEKFIIENA